MTEIPPKHLPKYPHWSPAPEIVEGRPNIKFTLPAVVDLVFRHTPGRRHTAIQAGAHLGIWPAKLSGKFERVITFEPVQENWLAAVKSITSTNVIVLPCALSSEVKELPIAESTKRYSGSHLVHPDGRGFPNVAISIDALPRWMTRYVDAIVLDVEGHEIDVLRGAERVIRECKPLIVFEENATSRRIQPAGTVAAHLEQFGYVRVANYHDDYLYSVPDDKLLKLDRRKNLLRNRRGRINRR